MAVWNEAEGTAFYLLAAGSNPNVANDNGLSALHLAARYGYTGLIRAMVDRGAKDTFQALQGLLMC